MNSNFRRSADVFQMQQGHRKKPSQLEACKDLLVQFLEAGDPEAATSCFEKAVAEGVIQKNRVFFHSLIHECAKAKAAEACVWITAQMVRMGISPTIITFNALIDACAKARNVTLATTMWNLMSELNLRPTCITYNTMLNACAQVHNGAQAEIWMRRMLSSGVRPCIVSYSSVISAFARAGDVDKAEEWFWRLQNSGLQADRRIFNSMINACAKADNLEQAVFWFEVMGSAGITPDEKTYNSLIHASARVGSIQNATRWLTAMAQERLRPDQVTLSSVVHACAKGGNAEEAEEWMHKMTSMGVAPNDVCYNAVLHACASTGDHEGAHRWIQQMLKFGIAPNHITYNCMIDACAKSGALSQCRMWLENMINGGFHPDQRTYTTLSHAGTYGFVGTQREHLWAFESIIFAYARAGKMDRVKQWLSKMSNDGLVPTACVRNQLLHLCDDREAPIISEISKKISMANDADSVHYAFSHNSSHTRCKGPGNNWRHGTNPAELQTRSQSYKGKGRRDQHWNHRSGDDPQGGVYPCDISGAVLPVSQSYKRSAQRQQFFNTCKSGDIPPGNEEDVSRPALAAAVANFARPGVASNNGRLQNLIQELSPQALAAIEMNPPLLQHASQIGYASSNMLPVANSHAAQDHKGFCTPANDTSTNDIGIGACIAQASQAWDTFHSIPYPSQMTGMI